jgi:hypothetical protein
VSARVRPSGIVGGLLAGLGAVVLLQQMGTVYITRTALIVALVGGLVAGVVIPSLLASIRQPRRRDAVAPANGAVAPAPEPRRAGGWAPTHVTTADGLHAYAEPDPGADLAGWVEAGVELAVEERRGDWVLVRRADGWSGWADARLLGPVVQSTSP